MQVNFIAQNKYYLSIVIPAYNEENRLPNTLRKIKDYVERKNFRSEIIVVDDGSTDRTIEVIQKLDIPNLKIVSNSTNQGKGAAVKRGVLAARGEYILFTDADNSTPIEELEKFLHRLGKDKILIGSRYLKGSKIMIKQPKFRIIIGRLGNYLIQKILPIGIKDTQCGFKLFPRMAAQEIFPRQRVKLFGFDFEILTIAKILGYKIEEIPVIWINSPVSRIRPIRDAFRTFLDLIYVKINLLRGIYK
ncbi:MAG: glycosyltransferase family 2 protein [Candidatus Omnitrophica bacterium]|nr:glycosyltransferase family 2 protein [Candidatus Omnitrophota bacterium]MCM8793073.1 glycosyltransferase family 2 protein [Candidatus Omnitrophota bacterium]